jgi:L-fuconolactonase
MRIDSHQHFWEYDPQQYPWITDKLARIRRSFLPPDLEPELKRAGMDGCIAVQARQTVEESRWLLGLADRQQFIKGIVGWVDLRADDVEKDLATLSENPKFVGVRHVAQDEPDDRFLVGKKFLRGISKLKQFDLAYDILIFPKQLPAAIELANRFPEQRFVLDHIAKPIIRESLIEPWRTQIRELAKAPNVWCKLSGMVTEANWDSWTQEDFFPYLDAVGEAFGMDRLMYGSDWPVCLLAGGYQQVCGILKQWVGGCDSLKIDAVMGVHAARFYNLGEGLGV